MEMLSYGFPEQKRNLNGYTRKYNKDMRSVPFFAKSFWIHTIQNVTSLSRYIKKNNSVRVKLHFTSNGLNFRIFCDITENDCGIIPNATYYDMWCPVCIAGMFIISKTKNLLFRIINKTHQKNSDRFPSLLMFYWFGVFLGWIRYFV